VLEFPLIWLVRALSPERLTGLTLAAVGNSVLWGLAVYGATIALARRRGRAPRPTG
jgi:hypothetical protein